jgi:hypothetical protein
MDNPETLATLGTRHSTKTNKTKNTTQETKKDEQQWPHPKTGGEHRCSLGYKFRKLNLQIFES